jgi:hypothetical protein
MSKIGRPQRLNADYFSHDSDASSDEKLIYLESLFGDSGYAWYFKMLETLTRSDNFEIEWSEIKAAILARKFNADIVRFTSFIVAATNTDVRAFCIEEGKLYSPGLKKRLGALNERRAKEAERMAKYRQSRAEYGENEQETEGQQVVNTSDNQQFKNGRRIVGATNIIVGATNTQSKVKESKVKKSKEEDDEDAHARKSPTPSPSSIFEEKKIMAALTEKTADLLATEAEGSLSVERVENLRAAFAAEMQATGKVHESEVDLVRHFVAWVRKKRNFTGAGAPNPGPSRKNGINDVTLEPEMYNRKQIF